jgi:hypothetical protein
MTKKKTTSTKKTATKKSVKKAPPKLTKKQKASNQVKTLIAAANPEPPTVVQSFFSRVKNRVGNLWLTQKVVSFYRAGLSKCKKIF